MSVPTSNTVYEAAVINAPLAKVWHLIKLGEFSSWWSQLQSSGPAPKGVSEEADVCVLAAAPCSSWTRLAERDREC